MLKSALTIAALTLAPVIQLSSAYAEEKPQMSVNPNAPGPYPVDRIPPKVQGPNPGPMPAHGTAGTGGQTGKPFPGDTGLPAHHGEGDVKPPPPPKEQ
jgi:hypothetical protein